MRAGWIVALSLAVSASLASCAKPTQQAPLPARPATGAPTAGVDWFEGGLDAAFDAARAQGKPVLFGPRMENFRDSVQVLLGRGGIQVADAAQLERVMSELLARPEAVADLGTLALQSVRQVSGASQRNVDLIARLLLGAGGSAQAAATAAAGR